MNFQFNENNENNHLLQSQSKKFTWPKKHKQYIYIHKRKQVTQENQFTCTVVTWYLKMYVYLFPKYYLLILTLVVIQYTARQAL